MCSHTSYEIINNMKLKLAQEEQEIFIKLLNY